jgi:hypothetical protein
VIEPGPGIVPTAQAVAEARVAKIREGLAPNNLGGVSVMGGDGVPEAVRTGSERYSSGGMTVLGIQVGASHSQIYGRDNPLDFPPGLGRLHDQSVIISFVGERDKHLATVTMSGKVPGGGKMYNLEQHDFQSWAAQQPPAHRGWVRP